MSSYADRVKETTSTTGTGTFSLDGASAGYQTFVSGVGTGVLVTYSIEDGADWEVGEGTITDGAPDTLSRTTILGSSNAGAVVSFGAGAKSIFLTLAAARLVTTDKANTFADVQTFPLGSVTAPSLTFTSDANTGIYSSAADTLNFATNGLNTLQIARRSAGTSNPTYVLIAGADSGSGGTKISVQGTLADIPIILSGKGSGRVYLSNDNGFILDSSNQVGSNTLFTLFAGPGYTESYGTNTVFSTANNFYHITSGTSTSAAHTFQTTNGTSWYNMFRIGPLATITGTQNYVAVNSSNPGVAPTIEAEGGDANVNLDLIAKGTGTIRLNGTATTISSTGAISTTQIFTHSGSTAHTVSTTGAVTFTGAVVQSTRGFASAEFSAGSGAPGTITWSNGQHQTKTLTSSGTMTFASPTAGTTYKLRIVQGGAGSFTITWPTIKWAGAVAPTLSTAVGAEDIITLYYNGTSYYGQAATGFA